MGRIIPFHVPLAPPGIGKAEARSQRERAGGRSQESGVRSQNEEHLVPTFCSVFRALRSLLTTWVFLPDQEPLLAGQQCRPRAKATEMAHKKRLGPGGAERFDPFGVGKLGWHAIRGRRAQNPAPLPTATHLQPLRGSDEKAGYIHLNPVRAGLVKRAEEWQGWSVHVDGRPERRRQREWHSGQRSCTAAGR